MINDFYNKNSTAVKQAFLDNKSIELNQFLKKDEYEKLKARVRKLKFKKTESIMNHRYSKANIALDSQVTKYVEAIIDKKLKRFEVWSFTWKDYTIVNDEFLEKDGLDVVLDITEDWDDTAGGAVHYIDGTGDFTKIFTEANKLVIFTREKNTHRFVKYVNNNAKNKKRIFLIAKI